MAQCVIAEKAGAGAAAHGHGRPLLLGLGGALRPGSSSERALACALATAETEGARTHLLGGEFLAELPVFDPRPGPLTDRQCELIEWVRAADGVILATPGYHGSISGAVKNALDTLALTRDDDRPYFDGRAVGVIVTAEAWQAAGTTLMSARAIVHAMRGWPTPFGAALNATNGLFDDNGVCRDPKDAQQLSLVARQVLDFARTRVAA